MIYVFEDNKDSVFSKLFRACYIDLVNRFIYLNGIPNAVKTITNLLEYTDEYITLYMDLVPDNKALQEIYCELRRLSYKHNFRLIIVVIPCIEYQFIKSVSDIITNKFTDICLQYIPYSELLIDFNTTKIKTFEHLCKAVIREKMLRCMSTDTTVNNDCRYYSIDCDTVNMYEKSRKLLNSFPAVPPTKLVTGQSLNLDQCWEVHRETVNFYNEAVTRFRSSGVKARYIKPIK